MMSQSVYSYCSPLVRLDEPADIFAPHDLVTIRQTDFSATYATYIDHPIDGIMARDIIGSQILSHLKAAVDQFAVTHRTPAA